jgi:hypothetical protein
MLCVWLPTTLVDVLLEKTPFPLAVGQGGYINRVDPRRSRSRHNRGTCVERDLLYRIVDLCTQLFLATLKKAESLESRV